MKAGMRSLVETMKAEGLQVWMRKPNDTWAYVTDGRQIAYIQWGDRPGVSTVHKPNKTTGTGFQFANEITPAIVQDAMKTHTPNWAYRDAHSVHKYADWNEFHNADSFNKEYREV